MLRYKSSFEFSISANNVNVCVCVKFGINNAVNVGKKKKIEKGMKLISTMVSPVS